MFFKESVRPSQLQNILHDRHNIGIPSDSGEIDTRQDPEVAYLRITVLRQYGCIHVT